MVVLHWRCFITLRRFMRQSPSQDLKKQCSQPPSSRSKSRRMTPRVAILALFTVIGLYVVSFMGWSIIYLSDSYGILLSFSSNASGMRIRLQQSMHQLRRRDDKNKAVIDIAAMKTWMRQLVDTSSRPPGLRCIGYKQTNSCEYQTNETPMKYRGCDQYVNANVGGYCLMEDETTGQQIQVMHMYCEMLDPSVVLSCRHAGDFVDFQYEVEKLAVAIEREKENARDEGELSTALTLAATRREGILMVVYPKLLVSAYASVRALRALKCSLPVELWYIRSEMESDNGTSLLNDIPRKLKEKYGPLTLHAIIDPRVAGFNSKIYAIMHTGLEWVLFMDADNVPVKDPSCLFESQEFLQTGAVFWPDFWNPSHTIFNIKESSLLWEILGMPFIDMFEQESGQLVIDKTRSSRALRMLSLFAFHDPNIFLRYKLVYGDKDLFRLAWLKTKTPFHMIANPPGIAGTLHEDKFCGMSMVQFDSNGEVLFLHRNGKKLKGGISVDNKPDEQIWTHLQRFQYRSDSTHDPDIEIVFDTMTPALLLDDKRKSERVAAGMSNMPYSLLRQKYLIYIYNGAPEFKETQWCYGQANVTAPHYNIIPWKDTAFPKIETSLLQYANEAGELLSEMAVQQIVQSHREVAR